MKPAPALLTLALALTATLAAGCASPPDDAGHEAWGSIDKLVAPIQPTAGNKCRGLVTFTAVEGGVRVVAEVTGLGANTKHGFHIHQFGDATKPDGTSAGGHYNPEGHDHALPNGGARHAGDLGNLEANGEGVARYERVVKNITLAGLHNPIVGRGVVVHANPDDGGQPTGNAGPRIGIGVIGIGK